MDAKTSPRFSALRTEYLGTRCGVPWYRLIESLRFTTRLNGEEITVEVPSGFETDFASVPPLLWWRFPHDGDWAPASVVHDYLYQHGDCSRFFADAIFRDGMAALGVPWLRRLVFYYAVRIFGGRYWKGQ